MFFDNFFNSIKFLEIKIIKIVNKVVSSIAVTSDFVECFVFSKYIIASLYFNSYRQ